MSLFRKNWMDISGAPTYVKEHPVETLLINVAEAYACVNALVDPYVRRQAGWVSRFWTRFYLIGQGEEE